MTQEEIAINNILIAESPFGGINFKPVRKDYTQNISTSLSIKFSTYSEYLEYCNKINANIALTDEQYIPLPDINYPFILKYDTSWDWLMPVVEKIEEFGYNVLIGFNTYSAIIKKERRIREDTPKFECTHNVTEPYGTGIHSYTWKPETKLLGVYISVIKFIKWYNQQEIK